MIKWKTPQINSCKTVSIKQLSQLLNDAINQEYKMYTSD